MKRSKVIFQVRLKPNIFNWIVPLQQQHEREGDVNEHGPSSSPMPPPPPREEGEVGAAAEEGEIQSQEATSTDSVDGKGNKRNNHGKIELLGSSFECAITVFQTRSQGFVEHSSTGYWAYLHTL